MTVSRHAAWAWSRGEHLGRPLTRKSARRRGEGAEPSGGLSDPQSSRAYRPQTSLPCALGDLNSRAIFKAQLIPAADQIQDFCCLLCCWCSCFALSSPSLHTSLRCKPHSTEGLLLCAHTRQRSHPQYIYYCLIEEPDSDCVSINSFFFLVMQPG